MHTTKLTTTTMTQPQPELVVLSHLRWDWVWQRPQHLVARFATRRATTGARTWFVEEPMFGDVPAPRLETEECEGVTRVWLMVPSNGRAGHVGFDAPDAAPYAALLTNLLANHGVHQLDVMLYTPMALDLAEHLSPVRMIYDVMDDLASFRHAPQGLRLRQRRAIAEADVIFTGGRSLYQSVRVHRSHNVHLFPSGVETAHFAASRRLRRPHERPVAGYVGVIDERMDLDLVEGLARALPEWTVRIVGPVTKIDPASLPQADNLEYPGMAQYSELPRVMAGFDVALMPFALNEGTRSISPTKTLEYLAAGLPVVSTRVPDVVADYSEVVHLADDATKFAAACREVLEHSTTVRDRRLEVLKTEREWDEIAARMHALLPALDASADRMVSPA